jgi:hypothetical protein
MLPRLLSLEPGELRCLLRRLLDRDFRPSSSGSVDLKGSRASGQIGQPVFSLGRHHVVMVGGDKVNIWCPKRRDPWLGIATDGEVSKRAGQSQTAC